MKPTRGRFRRLLVFLSIGGPAACAASPGESGHVSVVPVHALAASATAGRAPAPSPSSSVAWTEGPPDPFAYGAPGSLPARACGVVEMGAVEPIDGPDARVDARVCFSRIGCPAAEPVVPPPCTPEDRARAVSVTSLARAPAAWEDQQEVTLLGRLYMDPTAGPVFPAGPWRPEGPGCYSDSDRPVSLQGDVVGGSCLKVVLASRGALHFSCPGDWSRSCCSHLPLGQAVVMIGQLRVHRERERLLGLSVAATRWCSP